MGWLGRVLAEIVVLLDFQKVPTLNHQQPTDHSYLKEAGGGTCPPASGMS